MICPVKSSAFLKQVVTERKKYILFSVVCLFHLLMGHAQLHADTIVVMPFGKNGQVVYNLKKGTADIFQNRKKIIAAAWAAGKIGQLLYTSKDYTSRNYSRTTFTDALGEGIKYNIELKAEGLPLMRQVFYTYLSKNYFFTELYLEGQGLSSNYMAPLMSGDVSIFASGDNRVLFVPFDNDTFIRYNAKSMSSEQSNTSAEVGVVYENKSRNGLITGSVEHTTWKTGIRTKGAGSRLSELSVWGGYSEAAVTRDSIPHGSVSGDSIKSPKIFVGYFTDWRNGLEEFGKATRRLEKPYVYNWTKGTPVGWNSWGVMKNHLTYEKAIAVADFFNDSIPAFRTGNTAFIDLDSYWDKFLKDGISGDISILKQFADSCKSKGLQPGIYWAPFTDWGWNYNGSGKRKVEGSPGYVYEDIWTKTGGHYHNIDGGRAIDPTHPGTQQRIALFISKLKKCGFTMIKIDFLGHGAVEADRFYDTTVTTGMQAYRKGMEYLVDQLGDQFLIYAAISPNLATGRYVHMRRIACDAFKSINDTRYTLNSVNYGWWQTYIYNYIDADHIVFGNERAGVNRARLASGLITGSLVTGDDYSAKGPWIVRAREFLQNRKVLELIKNGVAFRPVEGNSSDTANELYELTIGNDHYLAVFNFSESDKNYAIDMERIGLNRNRFYNGVEIFSNKKIKIKTVLNCTIGKTDAVIYKFSL